MTEPRTPPHIVGHQHHDADPDEITPLLASGPIAPNTDRYIYNGTNGKLIDRDDSIKHDDDDEDDDEDYEPLPLGQCFLLCYARLVEPIAFFSIFPFVNEMVQRNGNLSETDVGFYSGLIESLFSLTQMCVMVFWGRASDRMGRKPVLVASLFGVAAATALFGFARTVWQMIFFRCLAGVFAGTVVTIRTLLSEISNARTQARAFSFFAIAPNIGIFLGPLLGGALANPAEQYGGVFEEIAFFEQFPYALPTIVTGAVGVSAAIVCLLFVKETKPPTPTNASEENAAAAPKPTTTMELLRSPGVPMVLYLYSHIMMLGFSFTAVVPLFYFTDPSHGGLGFSPFLISVFMAITGLSQAIWLLLIFPPLHNRFGTGGVLNLCGTCWPFLFTAMPAMNFLVRHHGLNTAFWTIAPPLMAVGVGPSMAFTAIQLALNDVSPSPETLGTLNALALTLVSGIRAFSPWIFTSLFAVSAKHPKVLGGHSIWLIMIALGATYGVAARWLPENAKGKLPRRRRTERREENGNANGR